MTETQPTEEPVPDEPSAADRRSAVLAVLLTLLIAAVAGTGAFLYGSSTGEDLDAAHAEGTSLGTTKGMQQGYAEGLAEGRRTGLRKSYPEAYRDAYEEAFGREGLDPPRKIKVPKA